jgi:hypothetical protein
VHHLAENWGDYFPIAGLVVLAVVVVIMWIRKKSQAAPDMEHERRADVNRVGRIVEGRVLELVDRGRNGAGESAAPAEVVQESEGLFAKHRAKAAISSAQKLLYYSYSISGVSYETAQDVTGMEERLHLTRVAAGQIASVKYDPSNPSNSILLADDWSGLH